MYDMNDGFRFRTGVYVCVGLSIFYILDRQLMDEYVVLFFRQSNTNALS